MQLVKVKSGYDQALISWQLAEYEQRNAVLTAPFDGVVANLFAKQFNTASTSDVFCSIIDTRTLKPLSQFWKANCRLSKQAIV